MGKRGPAPTPTAILRARDSWRGYRRNPDEPQLEVKAPACPAWLSAEARKAWRALVPHLVLMRVLTPADREALARYCETYSRWRAAIETLREEGEVIEGEEGMTAHPLTRIEGQLAERLLRLEREFGLTPAARSRLTVEHDGRPEEKKPQGKAGLLRIVG